MSTDVVLAQYLILHEDLQYKTFVGGVCHALGRLVTKGLQSCVVTSQLREFMVEELQSPLFGRKYDQRLWRQCMDDVHTGYDGVVLKSGAKLGSWLTPVEMVAYALVLLRDNGIVRVWSDRQLQLCRVAHRAHLWGEEDLLPVQFFDLPPRIQSEVTRLDVIARAMGI